MNQHRLIVDRISLFTCKLSVVFRTGFLFRRLRKSGTSAVSTVGISRNGHVDTMHAGYGMKYQRVDRFSSESLLVGIGIVTVRVHSTGRVALRRLRVTRRRGDESDRDTLKTREMEQQRTSLALLGTIYTTYIY